jgi:hypothetical protein
MSRLLTLHIGKSVRTSEVDLECQGFLRFSSVIVKFRTYVAVVEGSSSLPSTINTWSTLLLDHSTTTTTTTTPTCASTRHQSFGHLSSFERSAQTWCEGSITYGSEYPTKWGTTMAGSGVLYPIMQQQQQHGARSGARRLGAGAGGEEGEKKCGAGAFLLGRCGAASTGKKEEEDLLLPPGRR